MEPSQQLLTYIVIAGAAVIVTMLLLLVTKIPAVVTIGSAFLVGGMATLYARIDLGYWDPLAPVAFVATTAFAFAVSFALLAVGKWLRWSFFMTKRHSS